MIVHSNSIDRTRITIVSCKASLSDIDLLEYNKLVSSINNILGKYNLKSDVIVYDKQLVYKQVITDKWITTSNKPICIIPINYIMIIDSTPDESILLSTLEGYKCFIIELEHEELYLDKYHNLHSVYNKDTRTIKYYNY
jgi:hypothetical protein